MPYKRKESPFWMVRRRNLVGVGDTGVLTTKTKSKALARRMEDALLDVAERALVEPSYRAVLSAVVEKRLPLPDLLAAHAGGAVGDLRTAMVDPPLAEAGKRYAQRGKGDVRRARAQAVRLLEALAPTGARVSWLRDPRHVAAALHAAERGEPEGFDGREGLSPRKRNTVRRHLYRAVSLVLRAEMGSAERDRVLSEVHYPAEDDTREVALTPDDVARLIEACEARERTRPGTGYRDLGVAVRLILQTSADRGTLFSGRATAATEAAGLTRSQVRIFAEADGEGEETYSGELYIADTKTATRSRTVPLTDGMCRALLPLVAGKGPDEQVFALSYAQVDVRWKRVREDAGLPGLRLKDLRAQTGIFGELAGVPLTVVQQTFGHADEKMTRRYQRRQVVMSIPQAEAIERELGLTG